MPRDQVGTIFSTGETLSLPAFNPLIESEDEWRSRARVHFEEFLKKWAAWYREQLTQQLANGFLKPIKQTRGTTPLDLRYEWAAKRYCLNVGFKQMETDEHSANKISKTVAPILKELGLKRK